MKKLILFNNIALLKKILPKIDGVMIGIENFSVNMPSYVTYEEFISIYNLCKEDNKEVFVVLNRNFHNKDLEALKEIMLKLEHLDITGIVYYDIALVNIKLEHKLKTDLVWGQEHLTTNAATSNYWYNFGAKYTLVSSEITKEEIIEMKKNSSSKLIVTVFGYLPMFVSARHLVKNYRKTFDLKDNSSINYIEKEGNVYPIIDASFGTIAYSSHVLNGIKVMEELKNNKIDYILFNPFLIEDNAFESVLDMFNNVGEQNLVEYTKKIDSMFNTDYGFLEKETIYKVKKNG